MVLIPGQGTCRYSIGIPDLSKGGIIQNECVNGSMKGVSIFASNFDITKVYRSIYSQFTTHT